MLDRFEDWLLKLHSAIESRIPNFLKAKVLQRPAEKVFVRDHADLLARLAKYCARSYKWTLETFAAEMDEDGVTSYEMFHRSGGDFSWRPGVLFWMPVSYVALLFSFAFVVFALLVVGPAIWSAWHESPDSLMAIPGWLLEYIRLFAEFAGSMVLALLWWISSVIIAFFTALGRLYPDVVVSTFTDTGFVLGVAVGWLLDVIISPVMFWVPATAREWLQGLSHDWLRHFLYGLRAIFGLALFLGSLGGGLVFLFPRLASGRAFGLVAADGKSVTIIFCGSTFIDNFMINACVWLYRKPIRHRGFHRAWSHIKPEVKQWLAAKAPKDAEIFLSGHSLGGAIAEIAAFDLAPDYPIGLVAAFGSSRIGDPEMREIYKARLDRNRVPIHERTWHITHSDDTIPRLPPTRYFNHVGTGYLLSSEGRLYEGTRTTIYFDYLEKIHAAGFYRFFFDQNPLTIEEKEYPGLHPIYKTKVPVPPYEAFKWYLKISAFFLRDLFHVWFISVRIAAYLVYVYAMLVYYGRAILKGLKRDHKVSLYRDALKERVSLQKREEERRKREAEEYPKRHAQQVVAALGLSSGFEEMLDLETLQFVPPFMQRAELINRVSNLNRVLRELNPRGKVEPTGEPAPPVPTPDPQKD